MNSHVYIPNTDPRVQALYDTELKPIPAWFVAPQSGELTAMALGPRGLVSAQCYGAQSGDANHESRELIGIIGLAQESDEFVKGRLIEEGFKMTLEMMCDALGGVWADWWRHYNEVWEARADAELAEWRRSPEAAALRAQRQAQR